MGDTITVLLGETIGTPGDEPSSGLAAPGAMRKMLDLDPQQVVDKLTPMIKALEEVSSSVKGALQISEAEFCIGVDMSGNIGIRPLGGVEAGLKTVVKVVIKRGKVPDGSNS